VGPVGHTTDYGQSRIIDPNGRIVDDGEAARDTPSNLASLPLGLYLETGATLAPGSFWKGMIDDVRLYNRVVQP